MNSKAFRLTVLSMLLAVILALPAGEVRAQVRAKYSQGAAGLVQLLLGLPTTASALYTGAHPDDEDSALMARLARGDHARVAYLSLTRGEGGQNVIGPELFEGLGIIRSEELLQARRLDGGDQLFTRALDFGFSKSREETAKKWGEEVILGDMVRAIRMYRPLVLISRFTGTASDGHGHHRFVGHLTPIAFHQAGDPNQFPEQIAEGLLPWQPLKLYVSQGFRPDAGESLPPVDTILSLAAAISRLPWRGEANTSRKRWGCWNKEVLTHPASACWSRMFPHLLKSRICSTGLTRA